MAASTAPARPGDAPPYERHRPEQTPLYALVEEHFPRFLQRLDAEGVSLPHFVTEEFEAYLKCGRLEYGFLRVKCDVCRHETLVAFRRKRRGFCPSCGARHMADTAAHLVEHVLPEQPIRQWVLSFSYPLRFLFATRPAVPTQVLLCSWPMFRAVFGMIGPHVLTAPEARRRHNVRRWRTNHVQSEPVQWTALHSRDENSRDGRSGPARQRIVVRADTR